MMGELWGMGAVRSPWPKGKTPKTNVAASRPDLVCSSASSRFRWARHNWVTDARIR